MQYYSCLLQTTLENMCMLGMLLCTACTTFLEVVEASSNNLSEFALMRTNCKLDVHVKLEK